MLYGPAVPARSTLQEGLLWQNHAYVLRGELRKSCPHSIMSGFILHGLVLGLCKVMLHLASQILLSSELHPLHNVTAAALGSSAEPR